MINFRFAGGVAWKISLAFLSTTLKQLRQQRALGLSRLAEATGVSKAMLGQIERNESSPTVATYGKIATGLNVPFSHLFPRRSPLRLQFMIHNGGRW